MAWGSAGKAIERANKQNGTARDAARSNNLEEKYPMYVVSVQEVMTWDEWTPHQNLLAQGKLKPFEESMSGNVFFISHQWTAHDHPDPQNDQLVSLKALLRKLSNGEIEVKGNFFVEFMYGFKHSHSKEDWKKIMQNAYLWIDYVSMPQPLVALPKDINGEAAPHAGGVSDHRLATDDSITDDVSVLVEQLKCAVDSIPSYIERCAEMIVLVPSVKHADREGECCDFNTWRQRGWCRMEFVSSRLACGHDIPVMIVNSRETQPSYFNPCDTMKLFAGNGQFTMDDDKYKVRDVLDQMLTAKANSEFDAGNLGLARGHVLLRSLFLAGLPGQGTAEESQPDITDGASAVAGLKALLRWRDDASEEAWTKKTGVSLLHVAAALNYHSAAKELLASEKDRAMKDRAINLPIKNLVALDTAEAKGSKMMSGTNLRMSYDGMTPLGAAMMTPMTSPAMIELLISHGATDKKGWAFLNGCASGSLENMKTYHRLMKGDSKGTPSYMTASSMQMMGCNTLHCVAWMSDGPGQVAKLEWLLENGAGPCCKKRMAFGATPLAALAMNQEADAAAFDVLVKAGSDPKEEIKPWVFVRAMRNFLRLSKWLRPGRFSAAEEMITMASGGNLLHAPAMMGHVQNLKTVGALGVKVDAKNKQGLKPIDILHKAMPDSHAPQLVQDVLPDFKFTEEEKRVLKAKFKGAALAAKLSTTAQIMPNRPMATTSVVPTAA